MATNNKGQEFKSDILLYLQRKILQIMQCVFWQQFFLWCVSSTVLYLVLPSHSSWDLSAIVCGQNYFHSENCKHTVCSLYQLKSRFIMDINKAYTVSVYPFFSAWRSSHSLHRSFLYLDMGRSNANDQHRTQLCEALWEYPELATIQNILMASIRIPRAVIKVWFTSQSKAKWHQS